jgi:hypothetical protein
MGETILKFWGNVNNGKLVLNNQKGFLQYVSKFKGEVFLTIQKLKKIRSLRQNNYYWLYLTIISQETGDNPNDLHEFFKRKILPPRFLKVLGKEIKLPATTTQLSKLDFSKYIEQIEILTGIPAPDTKDFI